MSTSVRAVHPGSEMIANDFSLVFRWMRAELKTEVRDNRMR